MNYDYVELYVWKHCKKSIFRVPFKYKNEKTLKKQLDRFCKENNCKVLHPGNPTAKPICY